jgi:excinuclease ABC subunit B
MAKNPDSKKSKDPARPTRSKAAREPLAPIAPALEKLLNPGIAKGTAGVGSQTGLSPDKPARARTEPLPGANAREAEPKTGLQPPADNSWDRRNDFSAAHRARRSTQQGPLPNPPPTSGHSRPSSTGYGMDASSAHLSMVRDARPRFALAGSSP